LIDFASGIFAHPGRAQPARQQGEEKLDKEAEETIELAAEILEIIEGRDVNIGVSALATALVEVLASSSITKKEMVSALTQIREGLTPYAMRM
jgi:ribosomal protein L21